MEFPTLDELSDLVHDYFDSHDEEVSYDAEQGHGTVGEAAFSVHNLAANLARIDRKRWSEYVAWHFTHLLSGGPPELPMTYDEVRRRLRVRVATDAFVDGLPYRDIVRPLGADLHEMLMVSIDRAAVTVPPDSVEAWGQPFERLWADARQNTLWEEPRERRSLLKPTGFGNEFSQLDRSRKQDQEVSRANLTSKFSHDTAGADPSVETKLEAK